MNAQVQTAAVSDGLLALIQLGRRVREAASVEEIGFIAVNETRSLFAYRQAALCLEQPIRSIVAISGVAQPDSSAPYVQWLGRLFNKHSGLLEPRRLCAGDLSPMIADE